MKSNKPLKNQTFNSQSLLTFVIIALIVFIGISFFEKPSQRYFVPITGKQVIGTTPPTYYVDSASGSDTNPGTQTQPWRTIQKAADTMAAGDTAIVQAGAYDERVTITRSGSPGNLITFQASGNAKVKAFTLTDRSYITIQGFEVTHLGFNPEPSPGSSPTSSFFLTSSSNIQIIGNYIHDTHSVCIRLSYAITPSTASNNTLIKNNTIAHCGAISPSEASGVVVIGNSNLVEGNDISRIGEDFNLVLGGDFNVIRNNIWHDNFNADFPGSVAHIDGVQNYCSAGGLAFHYLLIENNTLYNAPDVHSHFVIFRDIGNCGNSDVIIRHTTVRNLGSYFLHTGLTPPDGGRNIRIYNNDAIDILVSQNPKAFGAIGYNGGSTGGKLINNIFYNTVRDGGWVYSVDDTSQLGFDAHNNLAYNTGYTGFWGLPIGSETGVILNQDPLFTGATDFHLQASSPAIDKGGYLTQVAASDAGSGTQLIVNDAGFFQDGWAGVNPDWIAVGSAGNVAQIQSIDYASNIITLATPLSRVSGDPIFLFKGSSGQQVLYGSAPDIGAYEYT